jgi:hypothetical protein
MTKRTPILHTLALAVVLLGATHVHATPIQWGYDWNASPSNVAAGAAGGYISLTNEPPHTNAAGNSTLVATQLQVFSNASASSPDTFTSSQGKYALKIDLTDTVSGKSGFLLFFGQLQGSFSHDNSNVTNMFFSPQSQSIGLGKNFYTVTMTTYTPPGPPSEGNLGSIGASVHVEAARDRLAPEPSTMALAGLCLALAGLTGWKRRRRAARS